MITMHTLPAISTFTNLYLSDVTMIPSDWWWIAAIGVSYTGANYIGTKAMGAPIYPVAERNRLFVAQDFHRPVILEQSCL